MNEAKQLFVIPVASTSFSAEAALCGNEVHYQYTRDGKICNAGIRFGSVRAIRIRAESACTSWHIDEAYDTLIEITPSSWVDEIRADTTSRQKLLGESWIMRHFMIYLDSFGCLEVIAESWMALPEECS